MPSVRSGMSLGILLMLSLSSLSMVLSASKADAQTTECQTQLMALDDAIENATFTNQKDEDNLLNKLRNAEMKLVEGKTDDAVAKLADIQTAVARLAERDKLDDTEANDIVAAADDAIVCLQPSSGT